MTDIAVSDLTAALDPNDPFKSWWESTPPLPVGTTFAQLVAHTLEGAAKAATTVNTSLALVAPNRVTGYAFPVYGTPVQATDGSWSVALTATFTGRKTINLLAAPTNPTNS